MASRTASAAITLPLLAVVVWAGVLWFSLVVAAVAALGALELANMARRWGDRPVLVVAMPGAVALVLGTHLLAAETSAATRVLPVVSVAAGLSLVWLLSWPRRAPGLAGWAITASVALYAGGLLSHAPPLRALDQGREWVLFLLAVTFATDTCAFFVGRVIGRRPLAPTISPSKTWEGALGGVIGALGAGVAVALLLNLDAAMGRVLVLGALIGSAGQAGDLVVSRMKRRALVSDSGWLVPGHGGLLDRLDSIVLNLVVVYYLVS